MKMPFAFVVLSSLLTLPLAAKDKPLTVEWRIRTLLDQSSEPPRRTSGHVYDGTGSVGTSCSTGTVSPISAGEMTYTLSRGTFPRDELLAGTVIAPIQR